jgi:hypothetical protein
MIHNSEKVGGHMVRGFDKNDLFESYNWIKLGCTPKCCMAEDGNLLHLEL